MKKVTQISGKYSIQDEGVFRLKQLLEGLDIAVNFPETDTFVDVINGTPVAFVATKERSLYAVEVEFFESIKASDFHTVHNKFKSTIGYVGVSTSIEFAYAVLHNRPVVLISKDLKFSDSVATCLKSLLEARKDLFYYLAFEEMLHDEPFKELPKTINYQVTFEEELAIHDCIRQLFVTYSSS